MNTLKSLVVLKSIAAVALIAAGTAAPSVSFASPDDGMVCRPGYSPSSGAPFKCTKTIQKAVTLDCTNPTRFPTKVIRAPGAPGDTSGGRDICTRAGVVISSTDALTGLVLNQDYVFAELNPTRVAATREATERGEEIALGVGADDVDAHSSQANVVVNGGLGSNDEARFTVTLFTFPVPAANLTLPTIQPISGLPRLP